jgi:YesN/AraC family two-component response regulator
VFLVVKLSFEHDLGDHILAIHITLVIYWISFQVIRQSLFFQPEIATAQEESKSAKKYEKSTVTPEIEEEILQKIMTVMQNQQPFLQADFSLPTLAKLLKVTPHQLSQVINDKLQQNFFEFTAQYRIAVAKDFLRNPQYSHLKIEEIAEMVGYNSKSAFNTSFKKIVGQTPSEFRKNV